MYHTEAMNEEIAVIIEQYADRAESRLPGLGPEWQTLGSTPDAAIRQLMERLHHHPDPTSIDAAPIAVSLLLVLRNASNLRPPTVVYAPTATRVLFFGDLNPIEPTPPEAHWLKPGEHIPEDAPDGSLFVTPHRTPPFHADNIVIRSPHGRHRFLHHSGGNVLLAPACPTVTRVHRRGETLLTPSAEPGFPIRNQEPDDRIAVILEQYRDHAEAYLPGMGSAWHITDLTPDGALEYLLHLIHGHHPVIPSRKAPVAVSLVTVHPDTANLHPAMVERTRGGVMALFFGRLFPGEEVPREAHRLRPGNPIPDGAPHGCVFLVPPVTEGLDNEGHCPPDAVVLQAQPGEDYRLLHHAGPVISTFPARLVRIEHGPWGELRHLERPVK